MLTTCSRSYITVATSYELIDHFADFLVVNLNDELLISLMYSHGLLAGIDVELITAGPTRYHRNRLILSYVQKMNITGLLVFNEVLQESHSHFNLPLVDGKLQVYLYYFTWLYVYM